MAKKSKKVIVKLVPKEAKEKGLPIRCFYTTTKNPKMEGGQNGKIVKKKYNWDTRKHEEFVEGKVK